MVLVRIGIGNKLGWGYLVTSAIECRVSYVCINTSKYDNEIGGSSEYL